MPTALEGLAVESAQIAALRSLVRARGTFDWRVRGSSMAPYFEDGDLVTVMSDRDARLGDVIVYPGECGLIAHRVVMRRRTADGPRFLLKGDNCPVFDAGWIDAAQFIGHVVRVGQPGGRWFRPRRGSDLLLAFCSILDGCCNRYGLRLPRLLRLPASRLPFVRRRSRPTVPGADSTCTP